MLGLSSKNDAFAYRDEGDFLKEGSMKKKKLLFLSLIAIITGALLFVYG